jgi:hypothetical protein
MRLIYRACCVDGNHHQLRGKLAVAISHTFKFNAKHYNLLSKLPKLAMCNDLNRGIVNQSNQMTPDFCPNRKAKEAERKTAQTFRRPARHGEGSGSTHLKILVKPSLTVAVLLP